MSPRRRPRRRPTSAANGATDADGPSYSGEGDGGVASDAEATAAGRRPGLEDAVAVAESAAADTNKAAPFVRDDGGDVPEGEGSTAGRRPGLEAGIAVVEAAPADKSTAAPFFGDDGDGVSGAEGSADRGRPGLDPAVDVVEAAEVTNKVAPFAGRREAGGGGMAPALDASSKKVDPFSGSCAVGETSSSGGSYDGRCDDRVSLSPPLDSELPNTTLRTTTIQNGQQQSGSLFNGSSTELINSLHQSGCQFDYKDQGSLSGSLAGGAETMGKLSMIIETILSWQLNDVMDDNLYSKVDMVCNHLESTDSEVYMNAVSNLVIEECRVNLKASLQTIQSLPSAYSVIAVLNTDLDSVYFIDINLHHVSDANHKIHMARDGDIFVFSTLSHQDKDFSCSFTCFGMVVGTSVHTNFHQGFKAVMLGKPGNIKFGCFLLNVSHTINVWNTLDFYKKKDVFSGINYIMKLTELVNTGCNLCNNQSGWTTTASKNLTLSKSQLGIAKSLSVSVQCTHKHTVKLVTGPPGSGKTRIVVAVLHNLYRFDSKVLVCVSQKIGAFRLWKLLEESGYPIDGIVVLDSLKGTKLPKKFHQTCLRNKSHEFYTCLVMVRQWTEEMQMLLHLNMYCPSNCNHMIKDSRCSRTNLPLFTSSLFRKAFLPLALDMKNCLIELRDKFSKMCLPNDNRSDIATVLNLLQGFQNLLFNKAPYEEHIQRAFGYLPPLSPAEKMIQLTPGYYGSAIATQLNDARLRFADFLQTFRNSIFVPKFGNRKQIENYCVEHSRVIIGTPESIFQLHDMKVNSINLLIVDDAAQTREFDLITALYLTLNHILVLGDLCTSTPMVKSKVSYEAGYSLLQRLLKSNNVPHIKLAEQFAIVPNIFKFVNEQFYSGKIKNGSNVSCPAYNQHFTNLEFPNYCFVDVTAKEKTQDCIEIAGIMYMLDILQNCWEDVNKNLHIAIVCIPNSPVYERKDSLISKYASNNKIKLSIMYADSMDGDMYDVVLISGFFKNPDQIDLKDMTAVITRARHCFWFLGDLSACPGTLGKLVRNARDRRYLMKLNPQKLQMVKDLGVFSSSNNDSLIVGVESTWNGRPYRGKFILGHMRNQGNNDFCALHSSMTTTESQYKFEYARHEPPEEFDWTLCTCDLNKKYKDVVDEEIGDEAIEHRGSKRLETIHNILENPGVLGYKRLQPEVTKLFSVKSCSKLELKTNEDMRTVLAALDAGSVFVGNYRVSRNYFSLKPGEVYNYDRTMPYLSPRSSLPYSHAVMMIGSGTELIKLPTRERKVHLNFQNSAGNLFGDNGFGKVGSSSVRSLYRITV